MADEYARCWGCWRPMVGSRILCPACRKQENRDLMALGFVVAAIAGWLVWMAL